MANANMPIVWENGRRNLMELVPAKYNPRKMPKRQAAELRKSLERFGLVDPIALNHDGTVISGHQRLKVMLDLGIMQADVRIPNRQLSPREERELNLRLNKNRGEFDWDQLKENFERDLLDEVGFEDTELQELFDEPVEGLDEVEEPEAKEEQKPAKKTTDKAKEKTITCPDCGFAFKQDQGLDEGE